MKVTSDGDVIYYACIYRVLLHSRNYVVSKSLVKLLFWRIHGGRRIRHDRDDSRHRCCPPTYLDLSIDSEAVAAQTRSTECAAVASSAVVASA